MKRTRWIYIAIILAAAAAMSYAGKSRLHLDMDITKSLPIDDPVIANAEYVMLHHPVKDRIVIDLKSDVGEDALIRGAELVEGMLSRSGLFRSVGLNEYQSLFPDLISHIMENLPVLFTGHDLETKVKPMLAPEKIRKSLEDDYASLMDLEGIGQGGMIAADPLGLKNLVLARMAHLAPSTEVRIVRGRLISADGRHALITAEPQGSATDTAVARKIDALTGDCIAALEREFGPQKISFTLTPVGAYRAAIDNEDAAKKDTRLAAIFATVGIIILLLVGFPRPFLGLLALVPAVLGTIAAAFVYSLFSSSISVLAVGFGGTIISFTVDYGIAYLLFLDRPIETRGFDASREVWGIGLLAMLTTAVSFAFLFISGFGALAQIGYFAALGVVFTYIFVHTLFPVVFPVMPPAKRAGLAPLQGFVNRLFGLRSIRWTLGALAFMLVMLFFARPDFRADLASMNTVSSGTLEAEKTVTSVWGNVMSSLYLMSEAEGPTALQEAGDRLAGKLERDVESGALSAAFAPSMVFPGRERAASNLAAWRNFWSYSRVAELKKNVRAASRDIGFAQDAFDGFFRTVQKKHLASTPVPEKYYGMLGVSPAQKGGRWAQFSVLKPGPAYDPGRFHAEISEVKSARLFDPGFFSERLASIMLDAFISMTIIVGSITAAVALLYLLDLKLALISLAPTVFSLVCTLGTMNLLGYTPGIPTIIVSVIVIGMGTDYAMYLVRARQRYIDDAHPSVGLIRLTVALSACSTMIGFGVLALADHSLLRSAGLTVLMGIGYSFFGTALIVPPLLGRVYADNAAPSGGFTPASAEHEARVRRRYRSLEPYPRLFARFKMKFDPMFSELHLLMNRPGVIVDIGAGYGVPGTWLLELFPGAAYYGLEPDEKRRRIAAWVLRDRGTVDRGGAPDLPVFPGRADAVLMIDMLHYLDDERLALALARIRERISPEGRLIIRCTVPLRERAGLRTLESAIMKMKGFSPRFRTQDEVAAAVERAGFSVEVRDSSKSGREEKWFLAAPAQKVKLRADSKRRRP